VRVLLDSHTLIWAADNPAKLPATISSWLQNPLHERLVSSASIWEMAIKSSLGKLPLSLPYRQWMDQAIADLDLVVLPITLDHADRQAHLPWHHRDPFDRLLAAQALVEGIPLISIDPIFDRYEVNRFWE